MLDIGGISHISEPCRRDPLSHMLEPNPLQWGERLKSELGGVAEYAMPQSLQCYPPRCVGASRYPATRESLPLQMARAKNRGDDLSLESLCSWEEVPEATGAN